MQRDMFVAMIQENEPIGRTEDFENGVAFAIEVADKILFEKIEHKVIEKKLIKLLKNKDERG